MTTLRPPALKGWRVFGRLAGGGLLLALALSIVGWAIVALSGQPWLAAESRVVEWLAANRTELLNSLTDGGSFLSDTVVCIGVLVVAFVTFRLWLGRWRESWTVLAAIVGELLVFLIVTALVGRDRPAVERLDLAPPTSSFPSGHVAASVALYGCIAIIMLREMRPRWLGTAIAVVCFCIPFIVAFSRLYRGMHYPSDVALGALGGAIWLAIAVTTLLPRPYDLVGGPARAGVPATDVTTAANRP